MSQKWDIASQHKSFTFLKVSKRHNACPVVSTEKQKYPTFVFIKSALLPPTPKYGSYYNVNIASRWMMCSSSIGVTFAACAITHTNPHMLYVTLCYYSYSAYCLHCIFLCTSLNTLFFSDKSSLQSAEVSKIRVCRHILLSVWHLVYVLQIQLHISKLDRLHKRPDVLQFGG